jgi:hypothetical protein
VDHLLSMFVGYELLAELPYTLVKPTTAYKPNRNLEEDCVQISTCESPHENEIRIEIEKSADKAKRRIERREKGLFGTNCDTVEKNTFQLEVCRRVDEIKKGIKLNTLELKLGDSTLLKSEGWDHFQMNWRTEKDAEMSDKFSILVRLIAICKYIREKEGQVSFSRGHVHLFDGLTIFDLKENSILFHSLDASLDLLKYWSLLSPHDLEEAYKICFQEEIDFLKGLERMDTNPVDPREDSGSEEEKKKFEVQKLKRTRVDVSEESLKQRIKTHPLYYDLLFDIQSGPGRVGIVDGVIGGIDVRKQEIALHETRTVSLTLYDLVLSKNERGDSPYSISLEKGGMDNCRTAKLFQTFVEERLREKCRRGRMNHLNLSDLLKSKKEYEERYSELHGYSTVLTFSLDMDDIKRSKYFYVSLPEEVTCVVKRHVRRRLLKIGDDLRLEFSDKRGDVLLVCVEGGMDVYLTEHARKILKENS